ncbi:MAG: multi-sensor signal transduction histidine kinase, partial [uncultured bacterium]
MRRTLKQRFFLECYEDNLPIWECPSFLFVILGLITIASLLATFYAAQRTDSGEIVVASVTLVSVLFLSIGSLVIRGVERVSKAKRQAEAERRKTETVIANLTDGLVVLDWNQKVKMINPRAGDFLKLAPDQVVGIKASDPQTKKDFPLLYQVCQHFPNLAEAEREKVFREKIELGEREVEKVIWSVTTAPIWSERNQLIGVVKTIQDITREAQINAMKTEFISIASHQLRTPLASLKWFLELLLKGRLGDMPNKQREILEQMDESNERMIDLVESLLNVSRIERGKTEMEIATVRISSLVNEIIRDLDPPVKQKHIKFAAKLSNDDLISCDPKKVRLVLQNLTDNAVKYTPPKGGITVALDKMNYEHLRLLENYGRVYSPRDKKYPEWLVYSVQDSGIGIPLA